MVFGALSILAWAKEERIRRHATWLLSEEGLGQSVKACLKHTSSGGKPGVITRRGLAQQVMWFDRRWDKREWVRIIKQKFAVGFPVAVAERIADMQIDELLRRALIQGGGFRGLEPLFRLDPDRAKELEEDQFYYVEEY